MKTTPHAVTAVALLAAAAHAQPAGHAPPPRPSPDSSQASQNPAQVKFESLVRYDAQGRVIPLDGIMDIYALHRNPTIDEATWSAITPVLVEWMGDVDQSVIDNLDFIEKLDGGLLNTVDVMDMNTNRMVMEMMMQFLAIGPATTILEQRGVLTRLQSQVNTNIYNDYLQKMLDQTGADAQKQAATLPEGERDTAVVNARSRFIFGLMWRDARVSYARQLDEAAPNLDRIIADMKLDKDTMARVAPALASVRSAQPGDERRKVVKAVLAALPFDKRRELLTRARALAPPFNPRSAYVPPPAEHPAGDDASKR